MLVILGGLPGVGKTTIARELAHRLGAIHLRIDTIEQAIRDANVLRADVADAGYRAAYAVAADNLRLGRAVVADCVNSVEVTRAAWLSMATATRANALEFEIVCSDRIEHRRRIEQRTADIVGHMLPTWAEVVARAYEPWSRARVIDTAGRDIDTCVDEISRAVRES